MSTEGPISLFGVRWSGHSSSSGGRSARGSIRVQEAVTAERDGDLTDGLELRQVRSWIDGLNNWTGLTSVTSDFATEFDGTVSRARRYVVTAETAEPVKWQQGDATLTLQAPWQASREGDHRNRRHVIEDDVVLESTFPDVRRFEDHLAEQRKLADLLVLLYGSSIAFRRHQLRDERFVERALSGKAFGTPFVDLVSERTVSEHALPTPDSRDRPIASLSQIGPDGLTAWANNYEKWKRFVLPAAAVFGRRGAFVEDIVVSTCTSLEAASHLIGARPGEEATHRRYGKLTTATHFYRCLELLNIAWPKQIAGIEGLARAIANNYNTIKHPDRGDLPDSRQTILLSQVNRWLVRLLTLYLTDRGDDLLSDYRDSSRLLWKLSQLFDAYELTITGDGNWETHTPGAVE
jgi:hypothetical protein